MVKMVAETYIPRNRLFVLDDLSAGQAIELSAPQAHYLRNVLRFQDDEIVALFNGRDGEWSAKYLSQGKKSALAVVQQLLRPQNNIPDIWLVFALLKSDPMDFIAQKATELGVAALLPARTERTVVGRINIERMRNHVQEAAQQCERLEVPVVRECASLDEILANWDGNRILLYGDETGAGQSLCGLFSQKPEKLAILIGPEGGFSARELDRLRTLPYALGINLGPRILRAETAALAALTATQLFWGDWEKVRGA